MSEDEPPIQYYEVIDHKTIAKRGPWWVLLALCRDIDKDKIFVSFYKFRKRKNESGDAYWQKNSSFRWNNIDHLPKVLEALQQMSELWKEQAEL